MIKAPGRLLQYPNLVGAPGRFEQRGSPAPRAVFGPGAAESAEGLQEWACSDDGDENDHVDIHDG